MKTYSKIIVAAIALAIGSSSAFAGEFTLVSGKGKGSSNVDIGFSGDERTTDAQADVLFDATAFSVTVVPLGNASCTTPKEGMIRVITPDRGTVIAKAVGALCRATFTEKKGSKGPGTIRVENVICGDGQGNAVAGCGATENTLSLR